MPAIKSGCAIPSTARLAWLMLGLVCVGSLAGCTRENKPQPVTAAPSAPRHVTQAYHDRVQSGQWTREQGLVNNLRILAGERSLRDVYGSEDVRLIEGTGLVREAQIYLERGPDAATKVELRRLLKRILPEREDLLRRSEPAPDPRSDAGGAITPIPSWLTGLVPPAHANVPTYRLSSGLPSGKMLEVYYPSAWEPSSPRLEYMRAVRTAVTASFEVFTAAPISLLARGNIYLVFSDDPHVTQDFESAATATAAPMPEHWCLINVYRGSYDMSVDFFRQALAHEVFHCFQFWNFASGEGDDWWLEGSAEHFSNLVYPCTNLEWRFLSYFDRNRSIFDLEYGNFLLFQFLDGRMGTAGVISLLRTMPNEGRDVQARAFAHYPNMPNVFRAFGEHYVDGRVRDTCGAYLPAPTLRSWEFEHRLTFSQMTPRFSVPASQFRFDARPYKISKQTSDGRPPTDSAREESGSVWAPLPESFNDGVCPGFTRHYNWFPVNTDPSPAPIYYELRDISPATAPSDRTAGGGIDRCIVGVWQPDSERFDEIMRITAGKLKLPHLGASAMGEMSFGENGRYTRELHRRVRLGTPKPRRDDIIKGAEGRERDRAAGCWSAKDGWLTITTEARERRFRAAPPDFEVPVELPAETLTQSYRCSADALEIGGSGPYPPMRYLRRAAGSGR